MHRRGGIGAVALAAALLRPGMAPGAASLLHGTRHARPAPRPGAPEPAAHLRHPSASAGAGPHATLARPLRRWHSWQRPERQPAPAPTAAAPPGAPAPPHGRTVLVGIDPDSNGAIAVLRWDGPLAGAPGELQHVELYDMPTLQYTILRAGRAAGKRTRLDVRRIQRLLTRVAAQDAAAGADLVAYLEVAALMPGNGNSAAYMNGYSIGLLYGTLCMAGFRVGPRGLAAAAG
jgi:hypothetical protein